MNLCKSLKELMKLLTPPLRTGLSAAMKADKQKQKKSRHGCNLML